MESQGISKRWEGKLKLGSVTSFEPRHQPRADSEGPAVHPCSGVSCCRPSWSPSLSRKAQALHLTPQHLRPAGEPEMNSVPHPQPCLQRLGKASSFPSPGLEGLCLGWGPPLLTGGTLTLTLSLSFPTGTKPSEGQSPQDRGNH